MGKLRYIFLLFILTGLAACQKDESMKDISKTSSQADSLKALSTVANTGNTLAAKGILKLTIQDSTYTFDAATDSIAFVNVYIDNKQYFGITAINKAHTMSFGISSSGHAAENVATVVAGGQFLLNNTNKTVTQFTLSSAAGMYDPGKIKLVRFSRDSILAKGTFTTYLAKDTKSSSPFYKAEGSFELKLK